MRIRSLRLINFKNLEDSTIVFKGKNISGIYGPNGTGKTSVIEAIDLLKLYFEIEKLKNKTFLETERERIKSLISKGKDSLRIILEIEIKDNVYLIELKLGLNKFNDIMILKEGIQIKNTKPRSVYKRLIELENDISLPQPKIYLYEKNKKGLQDYFSEIQKEVFNENNTSPQEIILKLSNFNSFISIFISEVNRIKENNKIIKEKYLEISKKCIEILISFLNISVISLKEQALSNLEIVMPINFITENAQGTIPICCKNNPQNSYTEEELDIIKKVIENVNKLFPLLTQGAILECKKEILVKTEEGIKYSIKITVKRPNKEAIDIYHESTGMIKLFMLLSALMNILQREDAILLVDEIDVHIFEYLLAYLLEILFNHSKGQLIFTAHNLLPLEKLNRDSIILTSYKDDKVTYEYFKGKISSSTNLRLKYLKAQYLWSEDNIQPLIIKESKVESTIRELQKNA